VCRLTELLHIPPKRWGLDIILFIINVVFTIMTINIMNIFKIILSHLFYIEQVIRNCGHFLLTNLAKSSKFAVTQKIYHKNIKKSSNMVHFALKRPKVVSCFLS